MKPLDWLRLTKLPLSLLISVSALFGYSYGVIEVEVTEALRVFLGTLFIVFAGAVTNNVQDRVLDASMERTRVRPIPARLMNPRTAAGWALAYAVAGFSLLASLPQGGAVIAMGALGLFLYNAVYTPLKRRSVLAILPGALCGVCPPAMGWLAAGRALGEWEFGVLGALLFFWQIPHFWLILLRRQKDYSVSGLPHMLEWMSECQLARIAVAWVLCFAAVSSLVVSGPEVRWEATRAMVLLASGAIALSTLVLLWRRGGREVKFLFIHLNATLGLVMLSIIFDRTL